MQKQRHENELRWREVDVDVGQAGRTVPADLEVFFFPFPFLASGVLPAVVAKQMGGTCLRVDLHTRKARIKLGINNNEACPRNGSGSF